MLIKRRAERQDLRLLAAAGAHALVDGHRRGLRTNASAARVKTCWATACKTMAHPGPKLVASLSNRQALMAPGACQTPRCLQWAPILQVYFRRPCKTRARAFLGLLRHASPQVGWVGAPAEVRREFENAWSGCRASVKHTERARGWSLLHNGQRKVLGKAQHCRGAYMGRIFIPHPVCFITAGPTTKLCAWGEEESGGHVL